MKTLEDVHQFYLAELLHSLEVLEQKRLDVVKKFWMFSMPVIVLGIVFFMLFMSQGSVDGMQFSGIGTPLLCYGIYWLTSRSYVSDFKQVIISKLVAFMDPGLRYNPTGYIPQYMYEKSELFQKRVDEYGGDDCVVGRIEKTDIQFSELHTKYVTRDSKGNRRSHTIFKGLFFVADFNKHFHGKTFVLPDAAEATFGGLGTMFQKMNSARPDLVKLEDPEFEKHFVVYGSDQIESRYILSSSLMKRIMDFKKKTGQKIQIAFVASSVFIAISYGRNLFEPQVFKTILDFNPIRKYYQDLQTALGIVEDLNLNTRIWTKE